MSAHLLKVTVQAVFVSIEDSGAREVVAQPITVSAQEWRAFADKGGQFDTAIADTLAVLTGPPKD